MQAIPTHAVFLSLRMTEAQLWFARHRGLEFTPESLAATVGTWKRQRMWVAGEHNLKLTYHGKQESIHRLNVSVTPV
jgi:hypothetical protein